MKIHFIYAFYVRDVLLTGPSIPTDARACADLYQDVSKNRDDGLKTNITGQSFEAKRAGLMLMYTWYIL